MQQTTLKWATSTAVTAALLAGFITPANADTTAIAQANRAAAEVVAATGTTDVIPAAQTSHDAASAAIAAAAGGTVDVPKDPSNGVTVTTPTGQRIGIGIANADTARDAQITATGTTVYTDPATNSATAVQATTDGVRQLFTLNNADAPTDFTVPLTLPASAQLVATADGGYDIVSQTGDGLATTIAHVGARRHR